MNDPTAGVAVFDATTGPELDIVEGEGRAYAVVWPGVGARLRSMHRISLAPGSRTATLVHPSDAVYYVISGSGSVADPAAGTEEALVEGAMIHVDAGTRYELVAGTERFEIVGGPSPADPELYADLAETGG
jgi:quercetin dioxygenase-like cupin family protein